MSLTFSTYEDNSGEEFSNSTNKEESSEFSDSNIPINDWRIATIDDIPEISKLITPSTIEIFGSTDLRLLIELSPYSLVLLNNNEIICFVCLDLYPNIPALSSEDWHYWMRYHYNIKDINSDNTNFITFIAAASQYSNASFRDILANVFLCNPKTLYICVVAPPIEKVAGIYDEIFSKFFTRSLPPDNIALKRSQSLYICSRKSVVPLLLIRKGLFEDNDEIMEIVDQLYPTFREKYGDFYMARALKKSSSSMHLIVADVNTKTRGFMWVNGNVNVAKLIDDYELSSVHFFKKFTPQNGGIEQKYTDIIRKKSQLFFQVLSNDNSEADFFEKVCERIEEEEEEHLENEIVETDSQTKHYYSGFMYPSIENIFKTNKGDQEEKSSLLTEHIDWQQLDNEYRKEENFFHNFERTMKLPNTTPTAFAIEFFGLHKSLNENQIFDLLRASFEMFPDCEYALLSLSTSTPNPYILRYFTRLPPQNGRSPDYSLYAAHKNVVLGNCTVRRVTELDLEPIQNLLKYCQSGEIAAAKEMLTRIKHSLKCPYNVYESLVIISASTIVGIAILTVAQNVQTLRKYFELDSYVDFESLNLPQYHGKIQFFYINTIMQPMYSHIIQQICRITGFHSLYYTPDNAPDLNWYNNFLPEMYPVKPRQHSGETSKQEEEEELKPLPVYYSNLKYSTLNRKNIDLRIVIIGFSKMTQYFLSHLLYEKSSQDLKFSSITVIVAPGEDDAELEIHKTNLSDFVKFLRCFDKTYLNKLDLKTWVNFVHGDLFEIKRKEKKIVLKNKKEIKYDLLFFFGGVLFGLPQDIEGETIPSNILLINNALEGFIMKNKLKMMQTFWKTGYNIIVYGNVLPTWTFINYLLTKNVPPSRINFVIPYETKNDKINILQFEDKNIENFAFEQIKLTGINIYNGYRFLQWDCGDDNVIRSITFTSKFQCIKLDCTLFACFNRRELSWSTVSALRRSGIVLDGRVVVDQRCRTNDPCIYAAGRFVKFMRIIYAHHYVHRHYNEDDIAANLVLQIARDLRACKTLNELIDEEYADCFRLPRLSQPLIVTAILPRNYYFLCIMPPGKQLPFKLCESMSEYGEDLVTGRLEDLQEVNPNTTTFSETRGYCRVHLDGKGFIKHIFCLTKRDENLNFLINFFDLHESMLGNMKQKYKSGLIKDFIEYFCNKKLMILSHDRFHQIRKINEKIQFKYLQRNLQANSILRNFGNKKRILTESEQDLILCCLKDKDCVEEIQQNVLKFLEMERKLQMSFKKGF